MANNTDTPTAKKAVSTKRSRAMKKAWKRRSAAKRAKGPYSDRHVLSFGEEIQAYSDVMKIIESLPSRSRARVVEYLRGTLR